MHVRTAFASMILAAGLAVAAPAFATELKDPGAHFVMDVPNNWEVKTDGSFAMAYPQDQTFHLRMQATSHGVGEEEEAERYALKFLEGHFKEVRVNRHAQHLNWNNFAGYEIFGSGKLSNDAPGRFMLLIVVDKKDPKKGAIVVGTGTNAGFEKHQPGIYEALHTMRTY